MLPLSQYRSISMRMGRPAKQANMLMQQSDKPIWENTPYATPEKIITNNAPGNFMSLLQAFMPLFGFPPTLETNSNPGLTLPTQGNDSTFSKDFQWNISNQTKQKWLSYQPGNPLAFSFQLINKQTNQPQTQFDIDAEKKVHAFLVSKDFKTYKHVHPALAANGTLKIDSQDPVDGFDTKNLKQGDYFAYVQFKPSGSEQDQVLMQPIHLGPLGISTPPSTQAPDTHQIKNIDGYTVQMTNPPETTVAETPEMMANMPMPDMQEDNMPTLTITRNGKPVRLKPYLGMASHATILSQDGQMFEHVHPMVGKNQEFTQNGQTRYQGPIRFHTEIAKPGIYTMFSQFLIDDGSTKGKLITVPYTFTVKPAPSNKINIPKV